MAKRDPNPLMMRLRDRQGRMGIFHRSNSGLIMMALLIHTAVGLSLWQLGPRFIVTVVIAFHAIALFVITLASIGAVSFQVRAARGKGGWDELLITQLSDRDLVNGLLFTALRPSYQFALLLTPSVITLILIGTAMIIGLDGLVSGLFTAAALIAIAVVLYAFMALFVFGLAILTLHAALTHDVGKQIATISMFVVGLIAPVLFVVSLPLCFLVAAAVWYRYRVMCCSFRQILLGE